MDVIATEAVETTDTAIWKFKIHNCRMSRMELCLRYRGLVSYDRHDIYDRYNCMETQDTQMSYESRGVVFALQGASFLRQTRHIRQIKLYGNSRYTTVI